MLVAGPQTARAAWDQVARFLSLEGKPAPASANVLSEHDIEGLDRATPQSQAQLLLERSINHYRGANEQIAARVDQWQGRITFDDTLRGLFTTALNSDDLRVRAAAIEIDIVGRGLEKSAATLERLESVNIVGLPAARTNALWDMALIGNRGVEPDRVLETLLGSVRDPDEKVRYWAVEGLAYLGTDGVVTPLLDIFHDDPSPVIRERAACSLSQSGMLSEQQRRTAVPRLLEFAEDWSLDATTREWVFQALRDITGQNLAHDASAWRRWYSAGSPRWNPVTRDGR